MERSKVDTYTITRAMIESTVAHGIRSMEEDPKRSVRRLADLGKQFSKSRFQEEVFGIMQELLENENSSYYDMMANLLKNTDHASIKEFGVNMGYDSWTYGARRIREEEKQTGHMLPPTLMLRYHRDSTAQEDPSSLTIDRIRSLVKAGQKLGIFSYYIREVGTPSDSYELLELCQQNPDCAFVICRPTGRLTAAQIQLLKLCRNTMTMLPAEDPETALTAPLLRDQKILFGLYMTYSTDEDQSEALSSAMKNVISTEAAFFLTVASDQVSEEGIRRVTRLCYESRFKQESPTFIIDYYGDVAALFNKMANHRTLLEIGADGRIIHPKEKAGEVFPFSLPLMDALCEVMPAIDVSTVNNE
ncbi:MAG: hypothetical protein LKJ76_06830 [Lachnospiraceae bacterium]|nr:hypothetical protein [Lachnospiraceae bacterium]